MPNWIDEEGYDWHGKIQCGRCLQRFDEEKGEVPLHPCHDGWFTSYHDGIVHHAPKLVRRYAPGEEEKYWTVGNKRYNSKNLKEYHQQLLTHAKMQKELKMKTEVSIDIIDRNRRIDFRDGFTFSLSDDKETVQIRIMGEHITKTFYVDILDLRTAIKKLED